MNDIKGLPINNRVYVLGDLFTPSRFWKYELITEPKFINKLSKGFQLSREDTEDYHSLNDNEKNKIRFYSINGIIQKY